MDEKAHYDIVFAGFGPDYDDPMTYLDRLVTASGLNDTGYDRPRIRCASSP